MACAASYPLTWPGRTSTTERAPEMSHRTLPAPTSWYCAAIRFAGLGRYSRETRPSEVESPMCVTDWQEVRSEAAGTGAPPAGPAGAPPEPFAEPPALDPPFAAPPALVPLVLDPPVLDPLVAEPPWRAPPGGGRTEPAARVPVAVLLAAGARTAPLSPAQARASTMGPPVTAAQLPTPAHCACQAVRDRIRFQARSSAPRRIGSSTKRHDSAAIPTLA